MSSQCGDLTFKVFSGTESAVHRGEAQVRDLVQIAERAQDGQAHLIAGNLRGPGGPHGILDLLGKQIQCIVIDIAALTGPAHALDDLVAAKWLGDAAALHNGQHSGLNGCETAAALRA